MLYVIEDDNYYFVRCRVCGKRQAVSKNDCEESLNGYSINSVVSCRCGNSSTEIKVLDKGNETISVNIMTNNVEEEDLIKCPKCKSTQITAGNKGFGLGKAAVGGLILGPVGLLGGIVGSKKVKITCLKCGHNWEAGKA
ncbi:hypothetical protein [Paenibacillus sp. FSL K6-2524]|uniref:hypothetical protein n=1 Tax=Paenibacillus sp. FSL K6-2524 TaxID=2954516 RepID=UPI0030F85DCD